MKIKTKYISPQIKVEEILLENTVALGSAQILPGNEAGIIQIENWSDTEVINSIEENSRW